MTTRNLQKTCNNCGKIKPAADFYENPFSPDGLYTFCKSCFDEFTKERPQEKKEEGKRPGPMKTADRKSETPVPPEAAKTAEIPPTQAANPLSEKSHQRPKPAPTQEIEPAPLPEKAPSPAEEFDFIGHLLENSAAENKAAIDFLQIPKQIRKIMPRKRICTGCGKVEEIDAVEKNTVVPVHAWFCGICRDRGIRRRVIKEMTVFDYWGREFIVKKFISREMVLGVLKNKHHPQHKKPQTIYGSWENP